MEQKALTWPPSSNFVRVSTVAFADNCRVVVVDGGVLIRFCDDDGEEDDDDELRNIDVVPANLDIEVKLKIDDLI